MLSKPSRAWVLQPAELGWAEVTWSLWKPTAEETSFDWNQKQWEADGQKEVSVSWQGASSSQIA